MPRATSSTTELSVCPIAYIRTGFTEKFGLPRQGGLAPSLKGEIVFTPEFSRSDAVRGLTAFSHIWLIWGFHAAQKPAEKGWSATVRPPRLGGNTRVGVFATRSPFRPNPLGLSCVRLEAVFPDEPQVRLRVSGVDLLDGTPIYDIKPYIPAADSVPDASAGYTAETVRHLLDVQIPEPLLAVLPEQLRDAVREILRLDPRPGYADDPERIYGVSYAGFDIRFTVSENHLKVCEIIPTND